MKSRRVSLTVRLLIIAIGAILIMTVVLGCQREVKPTGTITLYTSVPTAIIGELKQEFEAANPGIYIEIYRKGTSLGNVTAIENERNLQPIPEVIAGLSGAMDLPVEDIYTAIAGTLEDFPWEAPREIAPSGRRVMTS